MSCTLSSALAGAILSLALQLGAPLAAPVHADAPQTPEQAGASSVEARPPPQPLRRGLVGVPATLLWTAGAALAASGLGTAAWLLRRGSQQRTARTRLHP